MQKDADLVELGRCCQTHIFLQNFVLIQLRTSPPKICNFFLQNFVNFFNFAISGLLDHRVRHVPHPAACPDSQHRHRLRQKCRLFLVRLVRNRFFCLVVRFSRALLHRSTTMYEPRNRAHLSSQMFNSFSRGKVKANVLIVNAVGSARDSMQAFTEFGSRRQSQERKIFTLNDD